MTTMKKLREAVDALEQEINTLSERANETFPKIAKLVEYKPLLHYQQKCGNVTVRLGESYGYYKFEKYYGGAFEPTLTDLDERKKLLLSLLEQAQKDWAEVTEQNKPLIANNAKVAAKITDIMKHIGIPDNFSVRDFKSRARYPKYDTHIAGYKSDLLRECKLTVSKPDEASCLRSIEEGYNNAILAAKKKTAEKEAESKLKKQIHELALLRAKYTPDNPESSAWLIREEILKKDKYLMLGYWLEENRNDWNDGCSFAEKGLDCFKIETDLDREIYNDIDSNCGEGWDGDGRCFRDCQYNYDALYAMCEEESLKADLNKLKELGL